jgi:hypothetical protein
MYMMGLLFLNLVYPLPKQDPNMIKKWNQP